ncbi:MAG: amidohydrolase family protein [Thermoanaerobaculia bacterium]
MRNLTRGFSCIALFVSAACLAAEPSNVPPVPDYVPQDALHYTILLSGSKAGDEAVWKTPDGKVHTFSQFNDRGRGPKLDGVYVLNDQGSPVNVEIKGNDYLKKAVEETFVFDGKSSHWKSSSEEGEQAGLNGFYTSLNGSNEELAMLVRALLAHANAINLVPVGQARLEKVRKEDFTIGDRKRKLTLYSVTGLGFEPSTAWFDEDNNFYASPGTWFATVRSGGESVLPRLLEIDQQVARNRAAMIAKKLTQTPKGEVAIEDVTVFDSVNAKLLPHQTVIFSGNKISSVGPTATTLPRSQATIIDGRGKTLLPGLWDMHAHVSSIDGLLNLASGVTTVRDLANDVDELLARKKRIEAGEEIGTRIVLAGILDGPGPFQGPTKALVSTPDEARSWIRKYHDLGYVQIKVYSSVKPELVPVIVEEAHKLGMRVSGHIPAFMIAQDAIRDGFDEMQHMNFIFLNFMPDVKETRTPARFIEPAKRSVDIDVKSKPVQDFIALLKEHKTVIDPTLVAFEGMITSRAGKPDPSFASVIDRMPANVRRSFFNGGLNVADEATDKKYNASFANWKRMTKELYDDGVPLVAGTDSLAGFAYDRELELYTEAGIPSNKVLQIATIGAARVMKMDAAFGSIEPGKMADMALVDGDPVANIADIRRVRTTFKDGKMYDAAALFRELGVQPAR